MNLDVDLSDSADGGRATPKSVHTLAFLPWLALSEPVRVAGVQFVPFNTATSELPAAVLSDAAPYLRTVLSGYVDVQGRPITRCTVACLPDNDPPWSISEGHEGKVSEATALLAFAGLAGNVYFSGGGDDYTNATAFTVYFQRFSEAPTTVAIDIRHREGRARLGGYGHGAWKFPVPIECAYMCPPAIDSGLVVALDRAAAAGSVVLRRLNTALSFVLLANTDAPAVLPSAEVILMASAFEQLLDVEKKRALTLAFRDLLKPYGSVTAVTASVARPGITFDPAYRASQEQWFVSQKWGEELYDLRSDYVHGNDLGKRGWGWKPFEHLVMAAFAFPLLVKLLLAAEGHYTLSEIDHDRCRALDPLLAAPDWTSTATESGASVWQDIVLTSTRDRIWDEAGERLKARLSELAIEE